MTLPLMPKATAVWLIENTALSFEQIAEFCGMHLLELQGIADGEVAIGIIGVNPVTSGQITEEELKRCEADPKAKIQLSDKARKFSEIKKKKLTKYTPVARRIDKPDAISWFIKHYPYVTDAQIVKLIGTTKNTIESVRSKTHWNSSNIKSRDPVLLGLCTQIELEKVLAKAKAAAEKTFEKK